MARTCDKCHIKMSPWVPRRKNEEGYLLCEGCTNGREGRPLTGAKYCSCGHGSDVHKSDGTRSCEYVSDGGDTCGCKKFRPEAELPLEASKVLSIRAQAHLTPDGDGTLIKVAHGNMDGVTVFHCPMCGSGQVINKGTAIECGFCRTNFTVLVQPQFSMMPQTVDGKPYGPGQGQTPQNATAPGAPQPEEEKKDDDGSFGGDQLSEKVDQPEDEEKSDNPFDKKKTDDKKDDDSDSGDSKKNPFDKESFITSDGVLLSWDRYSAHLALKFSSDREQTLAEVQHANQTRR